MNDERFLFEKRIISRDSKNINKFRHHVMVFVQAIMACDRPDRAGIFRDPRPSAFVVNDTGEYECNRIDCALTVDKNGVNTVRRSYNNFESEGLFIGGEGGMGADEAAATLPKCQ